MAVESLEYLTIKSVKKCMHPFDNTKLAAYTITFKDDTTVSSSVLPDNRHYQMIQQWVAAGNTIEDAD